MRIASLVFVILLMNPKFQERVEMSGRFRALEKAMAERRGKISTEDRREINRLLEEALPDTFEAKYGKVNENLARATCVARGVAWDDKAKARENYYLVASPNVVAEGSGTVVNVKLMPLGEMPDPAPEVTFLVADSPKKVVGTLGKSVIFDKFGEGEGRYEISAFIGETGVSARAEVYIVRSLPIRLAALKVSIGMESKEPAAVSLRHRLSILEDATNARPLEVVPDVPAELKSLREDAEKLAGGEDPYAGKTGEMRRAWQFEKAAWPARMYVPTKYDAKRKWPLVIALHGAGGSENFYFELYGAGEIRKLAEEQGYIVVAPRNPAVLGPSQGPANIGELVKRIAKDYSIDEKRVFLTGHSLGGGQALDAAAENPALFRGVAAIAPAGRLEGSKLGTTPVWLACGDRDKLIEKNRALAKSLAKVSWHELKDVEHILIVGETLPDVFDWFDGQR